MTSPAFVLESARLFYDQAASRGLADYVHGNRRADAAIEHTLKSLPGNARSILDIGCGIGRSSWEIARHFPSASIVAVDLSPRRIELARLLFPSSRLTYQASNILESSDSLETFDAIVMLDVYEHIAAQDRPRFHRFVRDKLNSGGVWILTCPTVHHQEYLRKHNPAGLQPVDENIAEQDVRDAAAGINGTLASFRNVTIWSQSDYFHAVITRSGNNTPSPPVSRPRLESGSQRAQRVLERAGIRVTPAGVMLPDRSGPTVCLVQPNRNTYSETFIRNQAERLPARVRMLHTGWFPTRKEDDSRLLPLPINLMSKAESVLPDRIRAASVFLKDKVLARYLRKNSIDVVLAEYGPTGASVMNACREAGVPLVVHFHGFDAYHHSTLDAFRTRYAQMFKVASALIAVSHEMEQQLFELGAPPGKVHYCPYGVDVSLFDGADPELSPPTFVAVGRFVDKKAPYLTLLAFRSVVSYVPEAKLIFYGDGELMDACKHLATALKIREHVEFRGARSSGEVAETFRSSRAFVQHSVRTTSGDSEGTPVAVLEAGAAGLPVVATRHAGIRDVVIEGETGFLVNECDIESMAHQMIQLARSPSVAGAMGRRARQHVASSFSLEKSIACLSDILSKAVREPK